MCYPLQMGGFVVFNVTFNNISDISWWSVLLMEETEKTTDLLQVTDKLYLIMLYRVHLNWTGFELTTSVMIGTDCICSFNLPHDHDNDGPSITNVCFNSKHMMAITIEHIHYDPSL